jgi:ectoine hydroxylase-related dioxygenase (phytanoyl-CoA dioxygenase family)
MLPHPLSREQIADFERDGFLVVRGFYDAARDIEPIQRAIYDLIGLIIRRHGLTIPRTAFEPDTFDQGFAELIAANRRYGSELYDAVKMIPAFVRLAASERNEAVLRQLRPDALPGFISRGYGIRIDIPFEDAYRSLWHQEYLFQLRSRDGLTLWSPLVRMVPELGPVQFAIGSHRSGIHRVYDGDPSKPGAYSWTIEKEAEIVAQYPHIAPLSSPGDLIVLDFQVLHCSGFNRSQRARWSMQMRLFNFCEESGVATGWKGAVAEGVRVAEIFPQYFVSPPAAFAP